jgi:transporter family-2 protein
MERILAILATLAAGASIAAQPAANSQLGKHVGILGAAFISIAISLVLIAFLLVASGGLGQFSSGLSEFRLQYAIGGIGGAAIVAVSLVTVRELGAGGVVAATVCTQLTFSVLLDRLGVLGLPQTPITAFRAVGVVLLIAGTVLLTTSIGAADKNRLAQTDGGSSNLGR